jgi:hypothetical protein
MDELIEKHSRMDQTRDLIIACEGELAAKAILGIKMHNQGDYWEAHEYLNMPGWRHPYLRDTSTVPCSNAPSPYCTILGGMYAAHRKCCYASISGSTPCPMPVVESI